MSLNIDISVNAASKAEEIEKNHLPKQVLENDRSKNQSERVSAFPLFENEYHNEEAEAFRNFLEADLDTEIDDDDDRMESIFAAPPSQVSVESFNSLLNLLAMEEADNDNAQSDLVLGVAVTAGELTVETTITQLGHISENDHNSSRDDK